MDGRESEPSPRPHRDPSAELRRSDAIVSAVGELLRAGCVVAMKGLGGFHLACDATNEDAVRRLRQRKHRWGKPLAVMVRDLEAARALGQVGPEEEALLAGSVRPIVLLRRLREDGEFDDDLAWGVAEQLTEVGVMLPYTPLHHLLLAEVDRPLVMTSGNLSEEPIVTGNAEALQKLGGIADAFLLHDRDIYSRYDDSVVRVVEGRTELVRRARGYAPFPLQLSFETDTDILAAGSEQKNTFTLLTGRYGFVSQHIGDLENAETLDAYERHARALRAAVPNRPEDRRVRPASGVPLDEVGARARPAQGGRAAPPRPHRLGHRRARHRHADHRHRLRRHRLRHRRPHLGWRGPRRRLGAASSASPTSPRYRSWVARRRSAVRLGWRSRRSTPSACSTIPVPRRFASASPKARKRCCCG